MILNNAYCTMYAYGDWCHLCLHSLSLHLYNWFFTGNDEFSIFKQRQTGAAYSNALRHPSPAITSLLSETFLHWFTTLFHSSLLIFYILWLSDIWDEDSLAAHKTLRSSTQAKECLCCYKPSSKALTLSFFTLSLARNEEEIKFSSSPFSTICGCKGWKTPSPISI